MGSRSYRCIVVGAGSAVGSRLCRLLSRRDHQVIGLEHPEAMNPWEQRRLALASEAGARVEARDVSEAGALEADLPGTDFVFLASRPRPADRTWKGLWRTVLLPTRHLLDSLERMGIRPRRVVVISSATVMGSRPGTVVTEEDAPSPRTLLARALVLQEHLVRRRCQALEIPYTILRPGHLVGSDPGLPLALLIHRAWPPILPLPTGNPVQVPLAHLDDVCEAALHLAKYPGLANRTFFLTDGERHDAASLLRQAAGVRKGATVDLSVLSPRMLGDLLRAVQWMDQRIREALKREGTPLVDPDLPEALSADLSVSIAALREAGFQPGRGSAGFLLEGLKGFEESFRA
ncbi:NAD(P)-dependent oxidoreductase [Myxococcota bacterium]|nr:NAD(P)-dependent oxidoreductase [Myxococcota bacterium]